MADSQFNEVYQLKVDTDTFKQGLDQLVQIYQQFLSQLGDQAQGVIAVSLFKGLQEQISSFANQVAELTGVNKSIVETAAEQIEANLAKIDAQEEALAQKRAERAKKSAEDEVAASQGGNIPPGAARNKAIDQQSIADTNYAMEDAAEAAAEAAQEKQIALDEARAARAEALDREINTERQALEDQYEAQVEADLAKQAALYEANQASRVRQGEEMEALQTQAIAENQRRNEASNDSWLAGLAEGAARIAQIYITWQLVNALFQGMADLIMAPIKAFEDGFSFINQLEVQADKLTGTLASNLQFSKDLGTNFTMAAASAKDVALALQQLSLNLNAPLETVQRVFDSIATSGGAQTVKTLGDMVTLTQQFVAAFIAAGRNADTLRSLVSQLPQVFQGNVQSTNAVAEALGVSGAQLHDIIASAKTQKDLTEQLQPLLQGQMQAVAATADHYRDLVAQLKLQGQEIEGSAALPLYEELEVLLKSITGDVKSSSDSLSMWARYLGQAVASSLEMLVSTGKILSDSTNSAEAIATLVQGFAKLVFYAAGFVDSLIISNKLMQDLSLLVATVGISSDARKGVQDDIKALADLRASLDAFDQTQAAQTRQQQPGFVGPKQNFNVASGSTLDQPVTDKGNRPSLSKPTNQNGEQKALLDEQLAATKDYYEQLYAAVKAGEDSLAVSRREGAQLIETLTENEQSTYNKAIDQYEAYIKSIVATDQKGVDQKKQLMAQAEALRSNLNRTTNQRSDTAQAGGDTEESQVALQKLKDSIALQKQAVTEESAYESQLASQGYKTQLQVIDDKQQAETAAYIINRQQLTDELSHISSETLEYTKLTDQIKALDQAHQAAGHLTALSGAGAQDVQDQQSRQLQLSQATSANEAKTALLSLSDSTAGYAVNLDELNAIQREDLALKTQEIALQLAQAEAKNKDSQETKTLTANLAELNAQQVKLVAGQVSSILGRTNVPQGVNQVQATATAQNALNENQNAGDKAFLAGDDSGTAALDQQFQSLTAVLQALTPSMSNAISAFSQKLLGFNLPAAWKDATTTTDKFTVGLDAAAGALKNLPGLINSIEQGMQQGGVLGGVGAGLSGIAGTVGAFNPLAGAITGAIGGIATLIGGIFTAQAKEIANNIKTAFAATVQAFQDGTSTLVQTIAGIQTERDNAVSQLSGQKGGKEQLDTLLPQLDQEIAQLKQQQLDLINNFNQSVNVLQLQSTTLSAIETQWQGINKQVTDYINAGGDAATAQRFLSLSLQQIQISTQDQLNQANQTAISDAQNLNSLLLQRTNLETSFAQQQFQLTNQDSLERLQDGSVARGQQLAIQQQQYDLQLADLNNQISLTTQKVTLESQVFDIATSTAALNLQSNTLTIAALNEQILQWKAMQQIIADITENGAGVFTGTGILSQIASTTPVAPMSVTIYVNVPSGTTNPTGFGNTVGDSVAAAIQSKLANGQSV